MVVRETRAWMMSTVSRGRKSGAIDSAGHSFYCVVSTPTCTHIHSLIHSSMYTTPIATATAAIGTSKSDSSFSILQADVRQFAGLLFGLSICATFFPLASVSTLISPDGGTQTSGIPFASLIAGLCVIVIGLTGMATGYAALVHDYQNKYLTGFLLIWVQTAWIPYITDMTNVGDMARTGAAFIPAVYNPTKTQVNFVGGCGILGVFCFGACFLGSLAFMSFALYAFQMGKPGDRTAGYYRCRFIIYSSLLTLVGCVQLGLGSFCLGEVGYGPLVPPVGVAMFTVTYPEITIAVGVVYILNGAYGLLRALQIVQAHEDDHSFQVGICIQYFCTVVLMILVQISYQPEGVLAAAAPSRSCLTLGAHVLPAFLDYKMRTAPTYVLDEHYGLSASGVVVEAEGTSRHEKASHDDYDDAQEEAGRAA